MGRYSKRLAVPFADFAGLPRDGRVLDVGCGPGALTAELARRAGPGRVTGVDPSEEFVAALRGRHPGVEVVRAPAEDLPFEGGCFDATLAQLVVHVMDDPVAGLREMARVTRDGGVVAACVWDFTDGGPIGPFWDAARALDPEVETGSVCPGSRAGHLADLFRTAGIGDIVDSVAVDVEHATFEDWWEPFTLGVAPSRAHVAGLEPDHGIARALQGEAAGAAVRSLGEGLGSARRGLTPGWLILEIASLKRAIARVARVGEGCRVSRARTGRRWVCR